jgi:hypothetical protein
LLSIGIGGDMGNDVDTPDATGLRYLDAKAVQCPGGKLDGLSLISLDDQRLGAIDGVLIDPVRRQLRYFVVAASRLFNRRRYLVPADDATVKMDDAGALRVEAPRDLIDRMRFDSRSVPRFTEDDLVSALFSSPTA